MRPAGAVGLLETKRRSTAGLLLALAAASLLACGERREPAEDANPAQPEGRAGIMTHVVKRTEGDRVPILLLHGAAFSSRTWEELGTIELLNGAGRPVLAVDLPGFGESEPTATPVEGFPAEIDRK